jgi:hypothetical protein
MINQENTTVNQYRRIEIANQFGFYVGTDDQGRYSFLVKLVNNPHLTFNSKFLCCVIGKRSIDSDWAMTVSIDDERYRGVFRTMIDDIATTVAKCNNPTDAEHLFLVRFNDWRTLFDKKIEKKMDFASIVGLMGELFFIKEVLIPKIGVERAIASWGGPESTNQDFTTKNGWFEIKTRGSNKPTVHINNSEQLTAEGPGFLVILPIVKSTVEDVKAFSLMSLYNMIIKQIKNSDCRTEFDRKLALVGFVEDSNYLKPCFRFEEFEYYRIDRKFPRIMSKNQFPEISSIEYDLYVPGLQRFRVGGLNDGHVS